MIQIVQSKKQIMLLIVLTFILVSITACSPSEKHDYNPDRIIAEAQQTATIVLSFTDTPMPTAEPTDTATPEPTEAPTQETEESTNDSAQASGNVDITFDPDAAAQGEILFATCGGCHGMDARGLPGVGKDLIESEFTLSVSDDELVAFITTGRPIWDAANTTGIDMPPKGGNPAFSEDDLRNIVAYIRSLQAAHLGASSDSSSGDTGSTESETTVTYAPELIEQGQILYVTCSACHGLDARGIVGLGKDLVESEFVRGLTDEEFVAFITTGRPIWDAANTTGIDMPPKGGNPAFSEDDLYAIVAYIRTLTP